MKMLRLSCTAVPLGVSGGSVRPPRLMFTILWHRSCFQHALSGVYNNVLEWSVIISGRAGFSRVPACLPAGLPPVGVFLFIGATLLVDDGFRRHMRALACKTQNAGLKFDAHGSLKIHDAKMTQKIAICAPSHKFVGLCLRNEGMYRRSEKSC